MDEGRVIERTVDVAGVPVRLRAPDASLAAALGANLVGFPETDAPPVATMTVLAAEAPAGVVPGRPPDDEYLGMRFWREPGGMVVTATTGLVLWARGDEVVIHQPRDDDLAWVEELVAFALTWVLGHRRRFVLHGAGLARDGRALLVLGHTGAGKSTLAAAGLEAGWQLLSDDRVVLDTSEVEPRPPGGSDELPWRPRLYGFHHSPAVPREIGGPIAAAGLVLDDPPNRAELPRQVLTAGGVPVVAAVVVGHSDRAEGEVLPASGTALFQLLLQSFAGSADPDLRAAFFPVAGAVTRLPCFELRHARDALQRRNRAIEHLDAIMTAVVRGEGTRGLSADR